MSEREAVVDAIVAAYYEHPSRDQRPFTTEQRLTAERYADAAIAAMTNTAGSTERELLASAWDEGWQARRGYPINRAANPYAEREAGR